MGEQELQDAGVAAVKTAWAAQVAVSALDHDTPLPYALSKVEEAEQAACRLAALVGVDVEAVQQPLLAEAEDRLAAAN